MQDLPLCLPSLTTKPIPPIIPPMTPPLLSRHCLDLSGQWQFSLGEYPSPDAPAFQHSIELPGSLQEQGFGDEVTVDTEWTARLLSRTWYTDPRYAAYRAPGNTKVSF